MSVCEGSGELREEGSQNTRRVSGCPGFSVGERRRWRSVLVQSWPWLEGATGRRRATPCQHTRPRLCGVHGRFKTLLPCVHDESPTSHRCCDVTPILD